MALSSYQTSIIVAVVLLAATGAKADLTLTFGGDVNFAKNLQAPNPSGVRIGDRMVKFAEMTSGLRPLIDGDINFANIETVVTDERGLAPQQKKFVFSTHPNGIEHLLDIGFNLFSLANNHSYNRGLPGLEETLQSMRELQIKQAQKGARSFIAAGIEDTRRGFSQAKIIQVGSHTVALAAIGITNPEFRASEGRVGVLSYNNDTDFDLVLQSLKNTQADLKVLSIHSGIEMKVTPEPEQVKKFERALRDGDVDVIIGHHPHVVRPVSRVAGKLILYSLGNYMMTGAANLAGKGVGMDYGLFGRAHFVWDGAQRRLRLQALEAIALEQMQISPRPYGPVKAAERIRFLNSLSARELGPERAIAFQVRQDGAGVACFDLGLPWTHRALAVCD